MTRLSHRDLDVCSCVLRELYEETSMPALGEKTLAIVSGLISCDVVSYDDWKLDDFGHVIGYRALRRPFVSAEVDRFSPAIAGCINDHPLFPGVMIGHAPEPTKISDIATRNQFRRTAIYNEAYRHLCIESQIICTLSWKANSRNYLVLNRKGKDFTERDRNVLSFLKPHIARAIQNAGIADAMAFHLNALGEGLDSMHRAVILADAAGRIHWQSNLAREWLVEFFRDHRTSGQLPRCILNWLEREKKPGQAGRPAFSELHIPGGADMRLIIYCGKSWSGDIVLTLVRERVKMDLAAAESLGLTSREAEILYWISEAKTRPEIGRILGVSWRTIAKHMEHLFAKLGVENRLQAQRMARELRRM